MPPSLSGWSQPRPHLSPALPVPRQPGSPLPAHPGTSLHLSPGGLRGTIPRKLVYVDAHRPWGEASDCHPAELSQPPCLLCLPPAAFSAFSSMHVPGSRGKHPCSPASPVLAASGTLCGTRDKPTAWQGAAQTSSRPPHAPFPVVKQSSTLRRIYFSKLQNKEHNV